MGENTTPVKIVMQPFLRAAFKRYEIIPLKATAGHFKSMQYSFDLFIFGSLHAQDRVEIIVIAPD